MAALRPPVPMSAAYGSSQPAPATFPPAQQPPQPSQKLDGKSVVETSHSDMIHDVQLDYYGRRLATCSSDRTIKIYQIDHRTGSHKLEATLEGHYGPVWQICWSHPRLNNKVTNNKQLLASASYDGRVIIWMEENNMNGLWRQYFEYSWHASSVNSVCFAPPEYNILSFACASSDGFVSICTHSPDGTWDERRISESTDGGAHTHPLGALSVSWSPAITPGALFDLNKQDYLPMTIVTAGCDQLVKIWKFENSKSDTSTTSNHNHHITGNWSLQGKPLKAHREMVRSVAWAPGIGLPRSIIASGGQDKKVIIWTKEFNQDDQGEKESTEWVMTELPAFKGPVWSVSWSITGSILGVASGEDGVSLWKEELDGTWRNVSDVSGKSTSETTKQ